MRTLCLAALILVAPQQPKAAVEGRVVRVDSGQPLSGASVTIQRQGARGAPSASAATTDEKGNFAFRDLDEGRYTLQIQAKGYVPQGYGQSGNAIPVASGETTRDIIIRLTPTANISGRIRESADRPLVNVPVKLLRYSYDFNGQRKYQVVGSTQTNDRGEYRMYWVTPGRYYLLAGNMYSPNPAAAMMARVMTLGANGNETTPVSGFAFYPGVTDVNLARTIDLQLGTEQTIDLTLPTAPRTYRVRGRLIDSRNGQPPPRATVTLTAQPSGLDSNVNVMSAGPNRNYDPMTGVIEFRDVVPGAYSLCAVVQGPAAVRSSSSLQSAAAVSVNVANADVDGIELTLLPAGSIQGRLHVEGQFPSTPPSGGGFRVVFSPLVPLPDVQRLNQGTPVNPDGTFSVNDLLPGDYRIEVLSGVARITAGGLGFVKEARFDGADILSAPLSFTGSGGVLDAVVAAGGGKVEGVVLDSRARPVVGAYVVLVPDRGRFRPDVYRTATSDASGRFSISTVPPGNYRVFSWEGIEQYAWFDPDLLARSENRGRAVRVLESATETVEVRIIPSESTR